MFSQKAFPRKVAIDYNSIDSLHTDNIYHVCMKVVIHGLQVYIISQKYVTLYDLEAIFMESETLYFCWSSEGDIELYLVFRI